MGETINKVLHRFCVEEQTADGYWGEHSQAGPTTGYDYLTVTQIALYWEYSKDLKPSKLCGAPLTFINTSLILMVHLLKPSTTGIVTGEFPCGANSVFHISLTAGVMRPS